MCLTAPQVFEAFIDTSEPAASLLAPALGVSLSQASRSSPHDCPLPVESEPDELATQHALALSPSSAVFHSHTLGLPLSLPPPTPRHAAALPSPPSSPLPLTRARTSFSLAPAPIGTSSNRRAEHHRSLVDFGSVPHRRESAARF